MWLTLGALYKALNTSLLMQQENKNDITPLINK